MSTSLMYRREIDGLRAVAVVPVILFHAGFGVFSGGFVGVDVFFVISGYLITTIIINELNEGNFSLLNFYERRARRILPALFFVLFCCLPFAWFLLSPSDMKDFSQSLVAVATFSSNILFWRESGYFDTAAEFKPLLHTWSLAVEEQFYILFPLFLMVAWRFGKKTIVWILVAAFVISLATAQWGAYNKPAATFYLLPTRAWELLIGSFAAFYLQKRSVTAPLWVSNALSAVGLLAILYGVFAFDEATPFPSVYALAPTVGTVLIILFAVRGTTIHALLSLKAFVGVGLISYSLYLWHQPVFAFWRHNTFQPSQVQMAILSLLCVLLAYFTYRFVELPFRKRGRWDNQTKIFYISSFIISCLVVIGVTGHAKAGFPMRSGFERFADLAYERNPISMIPCEVTNSSRELNYCFGGSNEARFALFGDSHADDKVYGLIELDRENWRMIGNSSCPPILNTTIITADGTDCTNIIPAMFQVLDDNPEIELVVISYFHGYPLDEWMAATHVSRGFSTDNMIVQSNLDESLGKIEAFYEGLRYAVDYLTSRGIKVILLIDIPELRYEPFDCLRFSISCISSRHEILQRQAVQREHFARLAAQFDGVYVFDPLPVFCDNNQECDIFSNGRVLYRDSHHLSFVGSSIYADHLRQWLLLNGLAILRVPHKPNLMS